MRRHLDIGLLLLRVGIGIMFLYHGAPKVMGGPEKWLELGKAMGSVGIETMPLIWGLAASLSEFLGALCLILGIFSRMASFLLLVTMSVATSWLLKRGDTLGGSSHSIELGIVFLSLLLTGPGRFSLDERLKPFRKFFRK